jgi:hypothetical protein
MRKYNPLQQANVISCFGADTGRSRSLSIAKIVTQIADEFIPAIYEAKLAADD